jgi:hypothetical protein
MLCTRVIRTEESLLSGILFDETPSGCCLAANIDGKFEEPDNRPDNQITNNMERRKKRATSCLNNLYPFLVFLYASLPSSLLPLPQPPKRKPTCSPHSLLSLFSLLRLSATSPLSRSILPRSLRLVIQFSFSRSGFKFSFNFGN